MLRRAALAAITAVALVLSSLALPLAQSRDAAVEIPPLTLASAGRPARTFLANAPDPHVIRVGDIYYAYATNGSPYGVGNVYNVQRYYSTDLETWTRTASPDALPVRPAWATQTGAWTWAPTVFEASNGQYVMYFATRSVAHNRMCIGRAVSSTPNGTFTPTGNGPYVCQSSQGGSIDPYHFQDPRTGKRYLYWKNDGNDCQPDCAIRLWGRRLDSAGNLYGSSGALLNYDRSWETPLIENPAMTYSRVGNRFRLFYSANWYQTSRYSTGYANCSGPLGPCTKVTTSGPWHSTTPYAYGPGGAAFFTDFEGKNWMAYHGYPAPDLAGPGGARWLFLEKVDFHNAPVVNTSFPFAYHRNPPHPFVDVPTWAEAPIIWITSGNVCNPPLSYGKDDGPDRTYGSDDPTSRAMLATILWRQAGSPAPTQPNPFSDVADNAWYTTPAVWAHEQGLITGIGGAFKPGTATNRAMLATVLWRQAGSPAPTQPNPFPDVADNAWYTTPAVWAHEQGLITGIDGAFKPGTATSRAMLATVLWRQAGSPTQPNPFSDVADNAWYTTAACWALEQGLITGIGGAFKPGTATSRAMLATVLWRQAGSPAPTQPNPFPDVADNAWYTTPAVWAHEQGLITGIDGAFKPGTATNRAMLATVLWRQAGSPAPTQPNPFPDVADNAWYTTPAVWAHEQGLITGIDGAFKPGTATSRAMLATVLWRQAGSPA